MASGTCPRCGGLLHGDGSTVVVRCENADEADYWDLEPDANPIYCNSSEGKQVKGLGLSDSPSVIIGRIVSKWAMTYSFHYRVIHNFRRLYFYRWELKVDIAGGTYFVGSFRIKSDLQKCRMACWKGRRFCIDDTWKRATPEMLSDMRVLAKLLGWHKHPFIHDAPLRLFA